MTDALRKGQCRQQGLVTLRSITIPGVRESRYCSSWGTAAAVVCGEEFITLLSRSFQVIYFDNRGTGLSDKPDMLYTVPVMADDAAGLLCHLGVRQAHVFGVSMGGMIAQELALRHPRMVRRLVLGCTSCGGPQAFPGIT